MEKSKYLYGASVQGIQKFIFETNELKDIVGASELVENICTKMFKPYGEKGKIVVNAAGNIKCIYSQKEDCEFAVKHFSKTVMEKAPGTPLVRLSLKYFLTKAILKNKLRNLSVACTSNGINLNAVLHTAIWQCFVLERLVFLLQKLCEEITRKN